MHVVPMNKLRMDIEEISSDAAKTPHPPSPTLFLVSADEMQGGADALHAEQNMRRPTLSNHIPCSLDASVDSGSLDTFLNVILSLFRFHPS